MFIHAARYVLALQHEGVDKEWWDLWKAVRPDPGWEYWDIVPKECGVREEEVRPIMGGEHMVGLGWGVRA
ncbi:hypothetical protein IAT38_007591 [Cryptococcus sp. DSM 104549]